MWPVTGRDDRTMKVSTGVRQHSRTLSTPLQTLTPKLTK